MTLEFAATVDARGVRASFELAAGETVALLGPNGAGKSTLLQVIAGLVRPNRGRVALAGRTLVSADVDLAPHRREVALLSQDALLFPHLNLRENVAFGPRSRGVARALARSTADTWLDRVGIAELADRMPSQVSGGQAQRAAVARALAVDPQLLLLDEPLSAVDVAARPALRQTLRAVLAERTAIVVTHDVLDALLLADRVIVLANGEIVEDGPSTDVLARPRSAFAAELSGLNLVTGTWAGDLVALPDGRTLVGLPEGPPLSWGEPVVATFRPQSVAVYREAPEGSPRNSFTVNITELEPLGDRIRVRSERFSADVTLAAVAELGLAPGQTVTFTVKATEVAVYGR